MRKTSLVFAVIATTMAVASCALVSGESTEDRLQRQLGLSDVDSTDAIRAGVLQKVPIGSSESDVVAFLKARGVGQDPLSGYDYVDDGAVIIAYFERDRSNRWRLVQFDYGINFKLDERRALKDVVVTSVGTGP
jgi:hypothetical protein